MNNPHSVAAMLGLCMFKKAVRTVTVTLETVPNKLHIKYKECRKKTCYNGLEPTELVSYYITRPLHLRSHHPSYNPMDIPPCRSHKFFSCTQIKTAATQNQMRWLAYNCNTVRTLQNQTATGKCDARHPHLYCTAQAGGVCTALHPW